MPTSRTTGTFARTTITVVMAVIAALAFVFSFGNVWALALRLGVPRPIAPLIAPMVDLSVVGLLVALHHLAAQGTDASQLRPATRLMHLCGLLTLALNTAGPLLAGQYGRAALDTVAPALLLGWGVVGPVLLRHLHAPAASSAKATDQSANVTVPSPSSEAPTGHTAPPNGLAQPAPSPRPPAASRVAGAEPAAARQRTGRPPAATMDQLMAIARPAVAQHGITVAVVKQALRDASTPVGSARFTQLMKRLKDEHAAADGAEQPEPARAHPIDA